jgi:hypothetical protein
VSRIVAAWVAIAIVLGFVPILRGQIRNGEVGVPLTGPTFPIMVKRAQSPLLFWGSVVGQIAFLLLILVGALSLLVLKARPQ